MRFSDQLKAEMNDRLLAAISSLKRAIGAPDHDRQPDFVDAEGMAHVYTTDAQSGAILNSLFHQFIHGDEPVFTLDKEGRSVFLPTNAMAQRNHDTTLHEIQLGVPQAKKLPFLERLDDYIERHLAPTRSQPEDDRPGVGTRTPRKR